MCRLIAFVIFFFCLTAEPVRAITQITVTPQPHAPSIDSEPESQATVDSVPGDAYLQDDSNWSDERAATIKDVVDYMPGVFDQPRDGAESDRLSVRGSGLADTFQGRGLLVLQDGIPINMADGEYEFPTIDPWLIRYAEVYPGANALQFGGSTFGGAINFITPNGITEPGYGIRAEGGSFGTLHGQLSAAGAAGGADWFASATGFEQDGYRQQNLQDTTRFNANAGWQAGDDFTSRIYVSHTHSDAAIPGALSLEEITENPRQANPFNLARDYQRDLDITRVADKSAWKDGPDRIDTTVYYTYRQLDNPVTTYEFQHNNDVGMRASYTHDLGDQSQWLMGANAYYGNAGEHRFVNDDAVPGAPILSRNLSAFTQEAYGQYEQHLGGKLFGIVSGQTSYDIRDIQQITPTSAQQNERYVGFNPRIGLRYDINSASQAFANLSHSFEPPTWNELSGGNAPGFNDLHAQRATIAEVGARTFFSGMHWQVAYYHGWVRDEFVDYQFANGDTATINAARTTKDGVEFGTEGEAARDLLVKNDAISLRASYTFSYFRLANDPIYGNNLVPGVPENYLRGELLYHHPSGISFGPNIEWSPTPAPVDLANTLYADSYALVGFRGYWESEDKRLNLYVEGRNLFNKTYIATYNVIPDANGQDGRYFYPGEGAAVYTGIRLKL